MFQRLGAADYTVYDADDYGYVTYDREGYVVRGGNHLAGTHIMGTDATTSVVDSSQRSWDHENLYLVGGGSMASVGTSNITLTIAAMCFRSAERVVEQLERETAPTPVSIGERESSAMPARLIRASTTCTATSTRRCSSSTRRCRRT